MGDADEIFANFDFSLNPTTHCAWMSDVCIPNEAPMGDACRRTLTYSNFKLGEYYKRYEYDEIPVKDYTTSTSSGSKTSKHAGTGDNRRHSLTNSHLDRLEHKILKNVSQELQTEDNDVCGLDSNLKIFKTTVEQIFETFYSSMKDFELYRERFHAILRKNKTQSDSVTELEAFIREMIRHIQSSVSLANGNEKDKSDVSSDTKEDAMTSTASSAQSEALIKSNELLENLHTIVESYKNDNYLTDSTGTEYTTKSKQKGEIFNIFLLSPTPCVEIKMNDRNMLSEINIKDHSLKTDDTKIASAENIRKLAAKKRELERRSHVKRDFPIQDKEIPIRVSSAKKNIYLNEDFDSEQHRRDKSLLSKICGYLCRKFRKA